VLPDDWMTRPANHRESILNLPDLTPDDIAHYYGEFTKARERHYLRRYGAKLSAAAREAVQDDYKHCAETG
jgi:hypothetical protein